MKLFHHFKLGKEPLLKGQIWHFKVDNDFFIILNEENCYFYNDKYCSLKFSFQIKYKERQRCCSSVRQCTCCPVCCPEVLCKSVMDYLGAVRAKYEFVCTSTEIE